METLENQSLSLRFIHVKVFYVDLPFQLIS
jgi:hypothetical protein